MRDINEFFFSGTVEQFRRIETRTGTPMISFSVLCWKERIRATAFKTLAEETELVPGDRVECRGHIQSTSWTDQNGQQRSGWQCIATEITRADDADTRDQPRPPAPPARQQQAPPEQRRGSSEQFSYQGGPF